MTFRLSLLVFSLWAFAAHADLYRWVDPETGSVKFSSYPPPWYNDEAQKRAPRVEHIPPRKAGDGARMAPGQDAPREQQGPSVESLERQRRALAQQIASASERSSPGARPNIQKQLDELGAVMEQLDKLNPEGAAARRAEAEALLQKIISREQK
jgi:hypothetical protein